MSRFPLLVISVILASLEISAVVGSPQSSRRRTGATVYSNSGNKLECVQSTIASKVERAPIIVTAKVERTFDTKITISVKRTIKGDPALTGKTLTVIDSSLSRHVCTSVVRLQEEDVRIFYLQRNANSAENTDAQGEGSEDVGYILNSESDRITYRNLFEVNSAVKDDSSNPGPVSYREVIEKPCETMYCPYNADCDEVNGRAVCRCPGGCPLYGDSVCGSDGVTYPTECHLKATSCTENRRVFVSYEGNCVTA